jgi:hypothetical protein
MEKSLCSNLSYSQKCLRFAAGTRTDRREVGAGGAESWWPVAVWSDWYGLWQCGVTGMACGSVE